MLSSTNAFGYSVSFSLPFFWLILFGFRLNCLVISFRNPTATHIDSFAQTICLLPPVPFYFVRHLFFHVFFFVLQRLFSDILNEKMCTFFFKLQLGDVAQPLCASGAT